ncbi:MAG: hypothetical protein WC565_05220 [Parcubacteria group bacterium]|jgi:hypothetical protein
MEISEETRRKVIAKYVATPEDRETLLRSLWNPLERALAHPDDPASEGIYQNVLYIAQEIRAHGGSLGDFETNLQRATEIFERWSGPRRTQWQHLLGDE